MIEGKGGESDGERCRDWGGAFDHEEICEAVFDEEGETSDFSIALRDFGTGGVSKGEVGGELVRPEARASRDRCLAFEGGGGHAVVGNAEGIMVVSPLEHGLCGVLR